MSFSWGKTISNRLHSIYLNRLMIFFRYKSYLKFIFNSCTLFGKLLCRFESKLRKRGKKRDLGNQGPSTGESVIPACNCKLKMLSGGQLEEDPESNYLMAGEDAASRKDASKKREWQGEIIPHVFWNIWEVIWLGDELKVVACITDWKNNLVKILTSGKKLQEK